MPTIIYYFHHLCSSSDIHQSITRWGCQGIGINSSFIFAFWAFRFLWPSYYSISSSLYHDPTCHVTNQSGTCLNKHGRWPTASLHISLVLKWSGTSPSIHEQSSTILLHISCVLKWLGTYSSCYGLRSTALSQISCILRWSRTYPSMCGLLRTVSLHISCVLKGSGTHAKKFGSICTASIHISSGDIFIYTLGPRQGSNFMDRTQITSKWFFYRCVHRLS